MLQVEATGSRPASLSYKDPRTGVILRLTGMTTTKEVEWSVCQPSVAIRKYSGAAPKTTCSSCGHALPKLLSNDMQYHLLFEQMTAIWRAIQSFGGEE